MVYRHCCDYDSNLRGGIYIVIMRGVITQR